VIHTCKITLLGNCDQAAIFDPDRFNSRPRRASPWSRDLLETPGDRECDARSRDLLRDLPHYHRFGPCLFVHGSPRDRISEYVFPEDIDNRRKTVRLFQLFERYCVSGHTHIPGIFTEGHQFITPDEIAREYVLGEAKVILNVGSVGQPRDGDDRACYVILEDATDADPAENEPERRSRMRAPKVSFRRLSDDSSINFDS
jgi:diadenosine tetraphosphatase ApaH/serine/threonine PP2A family protein phosphatase